MGTAIFLTAAGIEAAYAAICIATKSNHLKIRSIVRIAAFAVFMILAITCVLDWGPRYYAFAGVLLALAVIGIVSLIRRGKEKRAFKPARTIIKAIGLTALLFIAALPAIVFPQHKPLAATGGYPVGTVTYTYTDTNRMESYSGNRENRTLNVSFWYPDNPDGPSVSGCPLIVFSHGSLGIKTSNISLYNELASHGYVVCSIDHTYQCFFTTDADGHTTLINMDYVNELQAEDARYDRQQSYALYTKWMAVRTGDINFVIGHILDEANKDGAEKVYQLVRGAKIGVIGHSLGGSAALGIGRIRDDVSAVIALEAPFMCDIIGVRDGEFIWTDATYPVPVLNIYSDAKWNDLDEWPQYAENFSLLTDTDAVAFNVYIKGSGHLNLTDLALTSPFLTRLLNGSESAADSSACLGTINQICLAFFDCYLNDKGEFIGEGIY